MGKMIGNGTTLVLATDGTVAQVQSLEMPTWAGDDVDVTDLDSTDFMEFIYSQLADGGEFTAEIFMDAVPQNVSGIGSFGVPQLATITNTDGTLARSIVGSGYVRELNLGNATPGEAILGTLVFKYDGIGTQPSVAAVP